MIKDPKIYQVNIEKPVANFQLSNNYAKEISLDGKWQFDYVGNVDNFEYEDINWSKFKQINVPGSIEVQGYGKKQYVNIMYPWDGHERLRAPGVYSQNQVGIYVNEIVNNRNDYENLFLNFGGVEGAFKLYCNDEFVGYSEDSHTPKTFSLNKFIGEEVLKIVVIVYKYSTASWLEDQDFWRFFGIHRSVKLVYRNTNFIRDIKTIQTFNDDLTSVKLDIETEVSGNEKYDLRYYLNDEGYNMDFISNPKLWSPDYATLYELKVVLSIDGVICDEAKLKIGFRKVDIVDAVLKLNNKRLKIKGVNRHDFSRVGGRHVSREEMLTDVMFLKKYNFNAVRTSHYPNDSYFYELCDKYGLIVMDEVNLETHGTHSDVYGEFDDHVSLPNDNPNYRDAVLQRGINLYERDKNHACVLFWSLGNESSGGKTLFEMYNYFKNVDASRYVHYEGANWDERFPIPSDLYSGMYWPIESIKDNLDTATKPHVQCEYSHAMGNSNGNMKEFLELFDYSEKFCGGFIWEMFEHTFIKDGEVAYGGDFDDRPNNYNFIVDGFVQGDRTPTLRAEAIKYMYQPFNIEVSSTKCIITNDYVSYNCKNDHRVLIYGLDKQDIIIDTLLELDNGSSIEFMYIEQEVVNVEIYNINPSFTYETIKVAQNSFFNKETNPKDSDIKVSNVKIVDGDNNISISGEGFKHIFGKELKAIISITYDGKEYIGKTQDAIIPHFWRAPVNNDYGAKKNSELAMCKVLSYNTPVEFVEKVVSKDEFYIKTKLKGYEIYMEYNFLATGEIKYKISTNGIVDFSDLFSFGIRLNMKKEFNKVEYVGTGPFENYVDRQTNMLYEKYSYFVDQQEKHTVPQEYGNRCNVRSINISNEENQGISFLALNNCFEFSYKEEDDQILESCYHYGYLPSTRFNQLKIHSMQSGIGGTDTWQTWCLDEYITKSNEPHVLEFLIRRK